MLRRSAEGHKLLKHKTQRIIRCGWLICARSSDSICLRIHLTIDLRAKARSFWIEQKCRIPFVAMLGQNAIFDKLGADKAALG
jgi:hypothetical protein